MPVKGIVSQNTVIRMFEGYNKVNEVRINKLRANLLGGLVAGILMVLCLLLIRSLPWRPNIITVPVLQLLIPLVFLIPLHESIHSYAALKWGQANIKFGFNWKGLTPYCHIKGLITVRHYRIVGVMPLCVTGPIGLAMLLIYPTMQTAFVLAMALTMCTGDLMMIWALKNFSADMLVLDHPSEPGFDIFASQTEEKANQQMHDTACRRP